VADPRWRSLTDRGAAIRRGRPKPAVTDDNAANGTYDQENHPTWTNEEGDGGGAVTTVTFEEKGDKTVLVMRELYPSKEALDAVFVGMEGGMRESPSNWTSLS
jgi:hypothetical protein